MEEKQARASKMTRFAFLGLEPGICRASWSTVRTNRSSLSQLQECTVFTSCLIAVVAQAQVTRDGIVRVHHLLNEDATKHPHNGIPAVSGYLPIGNLPLALLKPWMNECIKNTLR